MQKKNLFASAMLMLCALFMLTGCEELISNFDNPVSAYLKVDLSSAKIYRGESYQIKYSTISDAKPVFKSADETVATVDENGVITGVMMGTTTISIELPATPYYNAASAEFTVEVDGLLKMPALEKEMAIGEEYNLGVTTVSDGAITYQSSNTDVAEVDPTGKVTAKACGDATITVHIEATPTYNRTEDIDFTAKVRIFDFASLKAYCTDASVEEPYVILADNAPIVFTSDLDVNGKKYVTIKGNKKKPAKLSFSSSKSIVVDGGFTLADVEVNANGSGHFIKGYASSTKDKVDGHIIVKEPVLIEGVKVTNLQKAFFYDSDISFLFENFTINNCFVSLKKEGNVTINFNKSTLVEFTISNSTFYVSDTSGGKNFIGVNSSKRPWEITGYAEAECKFVCDHNTFCNVAKTKQFFNTNRLKGQNKYKYYMNSNIFVDSSNQKIYGNMTNNVNQIIPDGKNSYWFNGTVFAETNYNGDEGLQTNPNLKDPANADFTPQGADQVAQKTGDPRWFETN